MSRPARQKTDFTEEQIKFAGDAITSEHAVVLRAALTGSTYEDMAEGLGLKVGTVKSRLNRARSALTQVIAEQDLA